MARSTLTWATLILLGLIAGQAAVGTANATSASQIKNVIYVADDHGQQGSLVDNLNQVLNVPLLPLYTDQFQWTTLYENTDFQSLYNYQSKGHSLAMRIMQYHRNCPQAKIYLMGFGAGTTVILKAAECLPPNTVTRIILLAPSVSPMYDLRLALLSSVEGIDSFYSDADLLLKCEVMKFGPTDMGKKGIPTAAGLVGFIPRVGSTADARLYAKLRQHGPVESSDYSHGGHYGYVHYGFLQSHIIPLLSTAWVNPCPTCTLPPRLQAPSSVQQPKAPAPVQQRPLPLSAPMPSSQPTQQSYVPEYMAVPHLPQPILTPQATTPNVSRNETFPSLPPPNFAR